MWNYIIVGAGSAGSALANRLSADLNNKVLLLEAGGPDIGTMFRVPMLSLLKGLGNFQYDWMDYSQPDPTRHGRIDLLSRGKVLGGSSSVNGMIYVRGNRGDYDNWAQMGCTGWDYDSLIEIFRGIEHADGDLPLGYGRSGPMHVSRVRGEHPLAKTFIAALIEKGVPLNPDYNGLVQAGVSYSHLTQRRGQRWSAARGYLDPIKSRANLKIETGSLVRRIVFDGKRAVGVEKAINGEISIERADCQVILSASTFNTPKLLMLSGIGDADHLRSFGIEVRHHKPAVGQNLQEHPGVRVRALVNVSTLNVETGWLHTLRNGLRYGLLRSGPATHGFPALAFVKLRPESQYPDIQIHFSPYALDYSSTGLKMFDRPAVSMLVNVNRSRSRGDVRLSSADVDAPLLIQSNLFGNPDDLDLLTEGARFAQSVLRGAAFARYYTGDAAPADGAEGFAEWQDYVRRNAIGCYHPCGTARMGQDAEAVVDPRLRVIGVDGLRVVDSSIIPQIPSGNINALSIAIGEKGGRMILEDR